MVEQPTTPPVEQAKPLEQEKDKQGLLWLIEDALPGWLSKPLTGMFRRKIVGLVATAAFVVFLAPPIVASLAAWAGMWMPAAIRDPYVSLIRDGFSIEEPARTMLEESHTRLDYVQAFEFDDPIGRLRIVPVLIVPPQRIRLSVDYAQIHASREGDCPLRKLVEPKDEVPVFNVMLEGAQICTVYSGRDSCTADEGDLNQNWWKGRGKEIAVGGSRTVRINFQATDDADKLAQQMDPCLLVRIVGRVEVFKHRFAAITQADAR